jgi:SAM-dependent methyltransferase
MMGDFESVVQSQVDLFRRHGIRPSSSRGALDLGAGPGYQSIALEQLGFKVTAVDTSQELLEELGERSKSVKTHCRDIRDLSFARAQSPELVACMGDTITHLDSVDEFRSLISEAYQVLVPEGLLVLTFRDLSVPRMGVDRFIPVRSDGDRILTCFLEDNGDWVTVTDLLHYRNGSEWSLSKSSYQKIKLTLADAVQSAEQTGFRVQSETLPSGMNVMIGRKTGV